MPKQPSSTGVADETTQGAAAGVPFESGATVRLQLPLHDSFASTLRVVLASLASDLGFSIDDIDDLRLAVSEVFSTLVHDANGSAAAVVDVAIVVASDGEQRTIDVTVGLPGQRPLDLDELARVIIGVAVDEFRADSESVRLVKSVTASGKPGA